MMLMMIYSTRWLAGAALMLCLAMPTVAQSRKPVPKQPVCVVAFVDFAPDFQERGLSLLQDYATAARRAPGATRFEVVRELALPNHFMLLESWSDEASRQAYEYGTQSKRFRADIQPLIGSPFTERLGHVEQP